MTEFPREFFKDDPVLSKLHAIIKTGHRVAEHTKKVLFENRQVKDFCEIARHFLVLPGNKMLYIHYDVSSWYSDKGAQVRIDIIGLYDNFMEFEAARNKELHSAKDKDIPNIN